jgi:hypothetical protein
MLGPPPRELAVQSMKIVNEVSGELAAGPAGHAARPHGREQRLGFGRGQIPPSPGRDQLHQQLVEVVHRLRAGPDQVAAPFAHQPQRDYLVLGHHPVKTLGADCHDSDHACVTRVVLAAVPDIEDPARVENFGGTSRTVSPSATNRCASCTPTPAAPSTAKVRNGRP